jgi:hypothetical protein
MNSWSIETRNRLLTLGVGTAGLLAFIWFSLVATLQESLRIRTDRIGAVREQLRVTRAGIDQAEKFHEVIRRGGLLLGAYEDQMAQGDVYRWMRNSLLKLQERHNVTITAFPPPLEGPLGVPPKVPYKAGSYSIAGTASYQNLGAFLADLENSSPFIRLKSLSLEATASGVAEGGTGDELSFRIEFVTLIKSPKP